MSEWQLISTAPRDGTEVLVWDGEEILAAHWIEMDWEWCPLYADFPLNPTHWQHLPDPPVSEPGRSQPFSGSTIPGPVLPLESTNGGR